MCETRNQFHGTPVRRVGRESAWLPRVLRVCSWFIGLVCRVWTLPPESGFSKRDNSIGQCAKLATSSMELRCGELDGNRRGYRVFCACAHGLLASCAACGLYLLNQVSPNTTIA